MSNMESVGRKIEKKEMMGSLTTMRRMRCHGSAGGRGEVRAGDGGRAITLKFGDADMENVKTDGWTST